MSAVAIVTGAGKGLGRAFSECLLKRGANVCLSDVNADLGEKTTLELQAKYGAPKAIFVKCDTSSKTEMADMFTRAKSHFGGIDLVVNNAGLLHEKEWEKMIQVNLVGVIYGTLLGLEHMRKDKGGNGGQIINIASSAGVLPVAFGPAYSASKHGVVAYTRSWAEHPSVLKDQGIRLNVLCPFFTRTDILKITEEQVQGLALAEYALKLSGVIRVEDVVSVFETLLDEDRNGAVVSVSVKGQKDVKLPSFKMEYEKANL